MIFAEVKRRMIESIEAEIEDIEWEEGSSHDGSTKDDSELLTKDDRD